MKAGQLRDVLDAAARMHSETGSADAAQALNELCSLFDDHKTKTVSAFATLVAQIAASELTPPTTSSMMGRLGHLLGKS
jgi:hypothetical protein